MKSINPLFTRSIQNLCYWLLIASLAFLPACVPEDVQPVPQTQLNISPPDSLGQPKKVVVYYEDDSTAQWNYGKLYAIMLRNLLGHFHTTVVIQDVSEYNRDDLTNFDSGIYIGNIYEYPLPGDFLQDVYDSSEPFMWINYNIWQFFNNPLWDAVNRFGFTYIEVDKVLPDSIIIYKGVELPRIETDVEFNLVKIEIGSTCEQLAQIELQTTGGQQDVQPYAIRCGDFFYLAHNPMANFFASYLVLADALHDFLMTDVQPSLRALVRFEDLLPGNVDYDLLRSEVDALYDMGVPFAFGVIPVNYDPTGVWGEPGRTIYLHQDFLLQELIRYMISKGGTPVIHGFTHQYSTNSGMDYEFWDGAHQQPLPQDGFEWALDRIDQGISEFHLALDFDPLIWETPHYSATPNTYFALAQRFKVVYERVMVFNSLQIPGVGKSCEYHNVENITQTLPYQAFTSFYGFQIIPENLGYLERGGIPDLGVAPTPQGKDDLARMYAVVRDGVVSFMFHHWQPMEDLLDTIRRIQNLGFAFVSMEDLLDDAPPPY